MTISSVEKINSVAKDSAEVLTKSSNAAVAGLASIGKAYQDLTARNVERLAASIKALSSVKTPAEYFEVQQKLMVEGFEVTVASSREIAELTASVFTAAFEPLQNQMAALQHKTAA